MIGLFLALLAGLFFAVSNIFLRRATYRTREAFSSVLISALVGMVLFGVVLLTLRQADGLTSLSPVGMGALAAAGIIHFVIGRLGAYTGLRLIGTNRSVPILSSNNIIAVLIAVVVLGESITVSLGIALTLVVGGVILVGIAGNTNIASKGMEEGAQLKGIMVVLISTIFWGSSPTLIKLGLVEVDSQFQAIFVSYLAASVVVGMLTLYPGNVQKIRRLNLRSLFQLVTGGVLLALAQLCVFSALETAPVSVVIPIVASQSLMIFPISYLFNRKIEVFGLRIILGAAAVVAGTALIFWIA